ncbi:MAG: hypothetical protein Q7T25_00520, partial [Sideroxyarcus sp.]|nr:hypothetical protein [Sideroxyarcus sp.]
YVCICAPSHPFPPINVLRNRLNPRRSVIDGYRTYIANQFEADWNALEAGRAYAGAGADLLLFYDKGDKFVRHEEGDRILQLCPGAHLIKTASYGHMKVLEVPELFEAVGRFLRAELRSPL